MQTVIEPTVVPQIIEIPATRKERRLQKMIEMVREGRWCRNFTDTPFDHKHCALGLIRETRRDG